MWLCVAVTSVAGIGGCRRHEAPDASAERTPEPGPAQQVRLSLPEKTRFSSDVLATGTLKPAQSASLAMPVPGTLARVLVRRGQHVRAGAPLAVLDSAAVRASLAQAEAGIGAAQAQLALADDALGRVKALWERGSIPEAQYIQTKGQRDLAAAQLGAAQAGRAQARVLLGQHTLVAPFSGVVIRVPDGTGMAVGPQAPLFVLEDTSSLVLETSLTQEQIAVLPKDATVSVVVPATGARVDGATVRLVVPSVDPATNRVPVEIAVPNPRERLLAHAFARAILPGGDERAAFRVAQAALTQDQGAFSLWMVGTDGRVMAVRVELLAQPDDATALVDPGPSGFPTGARVVDTPPLGITVGMSLVPRAMPGPAR
jgi:RND family efflux transporter MFP subunit